LLRFIEQFLHNINLVRDVYVHIRGQLYGPGASMILTFNHDDMFAAFKAGRDVDWDFAIGVWRQDDSRSLRQANLVSVLHGATQFTLAYSQQSATITIVIA
jgi:hypothetical protein